MSMKQDRFGRRSRRMRTHLADETTQDLLGLSELAQQALRAAADISAASVGDDHGGVGLGNATVDGVYIISVAARILEMHPQTLRKYERVGLVTPSRTVGMLRLYSEEDITRLRLIKHLVGDLGLNLAGVQLVLDLFNNLLVTRERVNRVADTDLRQFMSHSIDEMFGLLHAHMT